MPRSVQPSEHNRPAVLPDVIAPDLAVLFCGSAAGRVSAAVGAYYAGPGNRFWPILYEVGLTPRRLAPAEFAELAHYGLGLTDLCKSASGADRELPGAADDPHGLEQKVRRYTPKILAFVGKRPARALLGRPVDVGLQAETIGRTRLFVLPSPSGAARRYWDERPWAELAALVGRLADGR